MQITCYPYQIPFKKPFKAGNEVYTYREGVVFEMQKDGITAYGDAAPLPGFSDCSLEEVLTQFKELQSGIDKLFKNDNALNEAIYFYTEYQVKPSLCFALDTLILDWLSQLHQQPLAKFLFDDYSNLLKVNAVVGSATQEEMLAESESLINQGFDTLKFKVGDNFTEFMELLALVRIHNPDTTIRIDANKRWSLEEAQKNLSQLEDMNIEYCEEPLSHPSTSHLAQLNKSTTVPIALDETANVTENLEPYLPYISHIIFKPMVFGPILKLFATKALADTHDITTVFTSSLESGIGRMMTATLASGLGAKQTAHGLATGSLLTMDVWDDGTYINNGRFTLPNNIGLGKGDKSNPKNVALKQI